MKSAAYKFPVLVLSGLLLAGVAGCKSNPEKGNYIQAYDEMRAEMDKKKDPANHIDKMRSYALQELILTDDESDFVMAETPKILKSADEMWIIFFWKGADWEKGVQVVSTMAPNCSPVMAKRLERPIFP